MPFILRTTYLQGLLRVVCLMMAVAVQSGFLDIIQLLVLIGFIIMVLKGRGKDRSEAGSIMVILLLELHRFMQEPGVERELYTITTLRITQVGIMLTLTIHVVPQEIVRGIAGHGDTAMEIQWLMATHQGRVDGPAGIRLEGGKTLPCSPLLATLHKHLNLPTYGIIGEMGV
jgi:hypothetical protein